MKIEHIANAGRFSLIKVKCECGREEYALIDRWQSLNLRSPEEIIEILKSEARREIEKANRPYIRRTTREAHYKIADEYEDLARFIEEKLIT